MPDDSAGTVPVGLATFESYVEVTLVRRCPTASSPETTAVRLLGLLPARWACEPLVEPDRVRLRVQLPGTGGPDAIREAVSRVLADPALRGWTARPRPSTS